MLEGKKVTIKLGTGFDPIPADKYTCQIIDVNTVEGFNKFKGVEETRLNYKMVILDEKKEDDKLQALRGRYLWKRTSLSLHEKSWLFKLAVAVVGHPLTQKEKEDFDPESLVGKQVDCMVEITPPNAEGTVYNNIISFSNTKKPQTPWQEYPTDRKEVIEKSSSPAVAPSEGTADDFIAELEKAEINKKK